MSKFEVPLSSVAYLIYARSSVSIIPAIRQKKKLTTVRAMLKKFRVPGHTIAETTTEVI